MASKSRNIYALRFVALILWLGFVLAISFMEAPLKFQAPSVSLAIGLDIGRLVFGTLNKIEWVFLALLSSLLMVGKSTKVGWSFCICLTVILLIQTFYLLPILDNRAEQIIAGTTVKGSNVHFFYVGIEVVKAILLTVSIRYFITQNNKSVVELSNQNND